MERGVRRGDELVDQRLVESRALDQLELRVSEKVLDRLAPTGREVVEQDEALVHAPTAHPRGASR